ncbi:MAG: hypothetical protein HC830_02230 [Bacteroidetes bacterium]|nr:hypothetical protein [Bacteroidota bacterium]
MRFCRKRAFRENIPITLKANSSESFFNDEVANLVPANSLKTSLLYTEVKEGETVLSTNILYFLPPKDLNLPKVTVTNTVREEGGNILLELSSAKLVKNLYLSLESGDGFFSDNYFDILPGQTVSISFKPSSSMDLDTLKRI